MINIFSRISNNFRLNYLLYLAIIFIITNVGVRLSLNIGFNDSLPITKDIFSFLLKGFFNDCAALVFFLIVPSTIILITPDKLLENKNIGKIYILFQLFLFILILFFTAFSEYFFWDEFKSRFNFIAVDYLIYTTEVIQNIIESYPVFPVLSIIILVSACATILVLRKLYYINPNYGQRFKIQSKFSHRISALVILYSTAFLLFFSFTPIAISQNRFWNEYIKNGMYELFSAYLNNQLDYRAFYKTIDTHDAFAVTQKEIASVDKFITPVHGENILRIIHADVQEKKPNVIIVIMESMGSKWFGKHTPHLNVLAENGLSFSAMMSTGTRTVRGIEALMLSVPPTPGNSIVRRPDNDALFTLGTLFRERGYDRDFIYGGIGYFDNMNAFFEGNGYTITDKLDFSEQSKTFSNAWGQCDEDLYSESLRLADRSFQAGRLFHQVLLTTSNHRPFTFPEKTVDMPQGSRRSAVQYADYAIGRFMQEARERPWFDNTVFVFMGDHPSSIAGKTEVPADAYGIICIMYGPRFFQREKITALCSQIDVGPTLLASLGWSYSSQFFGTNARNLTEEAGRAWISTYQLLGFRNTRELVVLKPDGSADVTEIIPDTSNNASRNIPQTEIPLVTRAVAFYQCAYDLFSSGQMKESSVLNRARSSMK